MSSFSIESAHENIHDRRTKDYFMEIWSSYTNENFRSSLVMLWSVIICDLVYKLKDLRDLYNDNVANEILNEMIELQKRSPRSSEWEIKLLDKVFERTELLNTAEHSQLSHLQSRRHLSAHPVLSDDDLLFNPTREEARAFIRCALESVFLKPPILSQKIFTVLVTDLAENRQFLLSDKDLKRYLEARYFKNLNQNVKKQLFRSLWRIIFKTDTPEADENRNINFRTLQILFKRQHKELSSFVEEKKDFFSEIGSLNNQLEYLHQFVSQNPSIFKKLNDVAKIQLEKLAKDDFNVFAGAMYLSENFELHLGNLKRAVDKKDQIYFKQYPENYISQNTWDLLIDLAKEIDLINILIDIAIDLYTKSGSYESSDICFEIYLDSLISEITNEIQVSTLIQKIEANQQNWGRRAAKKDHQTLASHIKIEFPSFDFSKYPNFQKSISH